MRFSGSHMEQWYDNHKDDFDVRDLGRDALTKRIDRDILAKI